MKQKIDIVINGNLTADDNVLMGGGILQCLNEDELLEYDTHESIVFDGDVHIGSINAKNRKIIVRGAITVFGKEAGDGE